MPLAISTDTLRRIRGHIRNIGSLDDAKAQRAERRLIQFGPKATELLTAATASADPQVRFRAVWALGKGQDARSLPAILELTEDPDRAVAYDAVLALGELGDLRAVPRLAELSARTEDERGLVSASWMSLRKLGQTVPGDLDGGRVTITRCRRGCSHPMCFASARCPQRKQLLRLGVFPKFIGNVSFFCISDSAAGWCGMIKACLQAGLSRGHWMPEHV